MGVSRIEQLIEDIYEFVESCKMSALSSTKVVVPKDELYDLLDELRLRTPDEIKKYQKIINNRDAIIADAEEKAATMLARAQEKTNNLISEHEIVEQAYYQAHEIVEHANSEAARVLKQAHQDADTIRTGALAYSEDMLQMVQGVLENAYESTKVRSNALISSIEDNLNIVRNNKKELSDQLHGDSMSETTEEAAAADDSSYNFEDGAFLDHVN